MPRFNCYLCAMKILILGSGGREHALAWKIAQSSYCSRLLIAPGNPGTAQFGINMKCEVNDFERIKIICVHEQIDMVVVGPEDPLVNGIYDFFCQDESLKHIHIIGPSKHGALLEGSKAFAKEFMARHQIPTANYCEFSSENFEDGVKYIKAHKLPIVLKADGLAAGKGVVIADTHKDALDAFTEMIQEKKFGDASSKVVIEEFLQGIECSVFVLTDGKHYTLLPSAKDYKRIGEGDTGLNTGGMGAISPVPFMNEDFMQKVITRIVEPTIQGLLSEQIEYKGFIFIGLIMVNNNPYVIEYNCRMGDPETEVVMPRLESDLVPLLASLKGQTLNTVSCKISPLHAATIMLVSNGYPEAYEKGKFISKLNECQNSLVFHAGTTQNESGLVTNGGRVLAITSVATSLNEALAISNRNAAIVNFEGKYYRKDIGWEF